MDGTQDLCVSGSDGVKTQLGLLSFTGGGGVEDTKPMRLAISSDLPLYHVLQMESGCRLSPTRRLVGDNRRSWKDLARVKE